VTSVVVVGAGVTGLTTAYALRRRGIAVTVCERDPAVGGVMATTAEDGYLAEHGPNSFLSTPHVETLLQELGLDGDCVEARPVVRRRYVVRHGRMVALPTSPPALLSSPLLSARGKLRAAAEWMIPARRDGDDESVAAFVRRRFGAEVLDYAVNPFVAGVYAGDPERLSVTHAFPRLAALEREHGSLLRGLVRGARAGRAPSGGGVSARRRMLSFGAGMATLPNALHRALGDGVRLSAAVTRVEAHGRRWRVEAEAAGGTASHEAEAVVYTGPAHALPSITWPARLAPELQVIQGVRYPPVATLTLGFRRGDVAHPLDGFGVLVPEREPFAVLGALFTSTTFAGRAPDGCVAVTCFLGGTRRPDLGAAPARHALRVALADLRALLGVRGAPVYVKHVRWPLAIPQYDIGHAAVRDAAAAAERRCEGLYFVGQFRDGVSVGDCVAAGYDTAARVAADLARRVDAGASPDDARLRRPVAARAPT
jgi:oxygen-dependent protoporphyrinogen oxidase